MSDRKFAIIDPAAGASGDMLLGALVAAGASVDRLYEIPSRLGLEGVTVQVSAVDRCGIAAIKVTVLCPGGAVEPPGAEEPPSHGHRHLGELIETVTAADLSDSVKARSVAVFRLLGEAEGRVHGVPPERVSLHEVGAMDALVDVVGVVDGFERLGITQIYAGPLALGSGWIRASHGTLPVPAPAVGVLVEGLTVVTGGPVEGEATTPTGAALVRVLSKGPPPVHWRAISSGWGAGTRNPSGYPNALRLILAEAVPEAAWVVVVSTDLDDLSPEYLEPLREALVSAGALDVQTWSTFMKKGRIGFRVEAIAPLGREAAVADAFFTHSTTAGVRWYRAERHTLARTELEVPSDRATPISVKVLHGPAGPRVKPEYDDVVEAARRSGRPALEVAAAARDVARARESEASQPSIAPKEIP